MDRLLYTALSGANVAQLQQQVHANNLANVNTEGFRADLAFAQQQALSQRPNETRVLSAEQPSGSICLPALSSRQAVIWMLPFKAMATSLSSRRTVKPTPEMAH